jgi:hypothetical protein
VKAAGPSASLTLIEGDRQRLEEELLRAIIFEPDRVGTLMRRLERAANSSLSLAATSSDPRQVCAQRD